ncbi:hypothetical protein L3Q82_008169 [Scortum barcoo]|uniref:Uncharacterized protein n=1 Tax=Scortum barcoo TaxID=214431 RepID=A0ACB8WHN7_9TELE|nr:hypothetical protein L3Q82_008169 [Scortum barcoo]
MQWSAGEGGCSERDKKRLNRLIKRASSVCGCPLDSIEAPGPDGTGDDETAYREEVRALTSWCRTTTSISHVSKTKELIVDFRRRQREEHAPLSINGTMVERVSSFRFLGVHISEDLTWTHHTDFITKSSQTAALLPPQAAEAQHGLQDTLQLLQVTHREYPDWCTAAASPSTVRLYRGW